MYTRPLLAALTAPIVLLSGCQLGPQVLRTGYPQYNQAIRDIEDEHMLLNLVRLRYADTPVFLQISSITTTYGVSVSGGASVSATDTSSTSTTGNIGSAAGLTRAATGSVSDTTGADVGASYSETPTITYALPESRDYFGRMLAPLSSDQLGVLSTSGVGAKHLIRLGVKRINRLANLVNYSQYVPTQPNTYGAFNEAAHLIDELERAGLIDLAYAFKKHVAASPIDAVDSRAIPEGEKIGLEFYLDDDGKYVAYTFEPRLHMRFSRASDDSPAAQRLRQLLNLAPDQYSFEIIDVDDSSTEKARIFSKDVAAALDPQAVYRDIVLQNRSLMEVMFYLALAIECPEEHITGGLALPGSTELRDFLHIRSSSSRPRNTSVEVQYEGQWFYIAADDLRSRSSFVNLNMLFAATAGTVPGASPLLTIPTR